ncbi:MAG TPA: murein biosynthesis integral membrane protein MurJ [Candidatus Atribacteria bacterium]|nr:murein biosynthesis integral membrane protein MurJ [Candidatus Atribacteria bacterium]
MDKTILLIMILSLVSKLIGFARDLTLSYYYGASSVSDAFIISMTVPSVIFSFVGAGISSGYIPIYSGIVKRYGHSQGCRFTNSLINLLFILATVVALIVLLFARPIVWLFASGFEGETLKMAVEFTRITVFSVYFTGLIYLFSSYLQMSGNYTVPALIGLPLNVVTIVAIILSSYSSKYLLPAGKVIATMIQAATAYIFMHRAGFRYKPELRIRDQQVREMIWLAFPVILGTSADQINILVDKTIASAISTGGISALEYAQRLILFVGDLFIYSVSTVLFPMISRLAAGNDIDGLKKAAIKAVNGINLLVLPVSVGSVVVARPIVWLLFGRGAFDEAAAAMTTDALMYYSIGMFATGIREVLVKVFFSLHDTKKPVLYSAVSMAINMILNLILSRFMGIGGLALASSISAMICTVLLMMSLRKKLSGFDIRIIYVSFFKTLHASLVMGLATLLVYLLMSHIGYFTLALFASITVGAVVYPIFLYLMNAADFKEYVLVLRYKFKGPVCRR